MGSYPEHDNHSNFRVVNFIKFLELQYNFLEYLFCCSENSKKRPSHGACGTPDCSVPRLHARRTGCSREKLEELRL
jgi:hypothetical protein